MIQKLLIANRGEVAVRITRAAADVGIDCVAVYAQDDADGLHRFRSPHAVALAGSGPAAYLDGAQLVRVARDEQCDAVHPGYGFLSEDASFARACEAAGLVFVGPTPETLETFGDKVAARALALACDVPVARGTAAGVTLAETEALLAELGEGRGVMIKALAGGGGRGMRPVRRASELASAFERCRSEALRAFGNDALYVEELIDRARHIEVQVVGDGSGRCTHLHERECSVQRQRQKLIEQAPAVNLPAAMRERLIAAALAMAGAVRLRSLCTFEFLVASDDEVRRGASPFVFIEANPRLQVEHTVTEAVLGIDLVRVQFQIASGSSLADLGLEQAAAPAPRGQAIELRINAESLQPDGSVRPAAGRLTVFAPPTGSGVRVDTAAYAGCRAHGTFDSLLAKVIVQAPGNDLAALARQAHRALSEFHVVGVDTNIGLLQSLLQRPEFCAGHIDVDFVGRHAAALIDAASRQPKRHPPREPGPPGDGGDAGTPRRGPVDLPPGAFSVGAPSPGRLVSVATAGQRVAPGDTVAVVEAMKMEHVALAPAGGTVLQVHAAVGDAVEADVPLLFMRPDRPDTGHDDAAAHPAGGGQASDAADALAAVAAAHAALHDAARAAAVERQHARAAMTARERIDGLCDAGTFIEFGGLVHDPGLDREAPADGVVTGSARIDGRPAIVFAQDFTVYGGSSGRLGSLKLERAAARALGHGVPLVMLLDGGGHRIQLGQDSREFADTTHLFHDMVRMSGWVPMVAAVLGAGFAANTNYAAAADFVTMVRGQAAMGLAGPALVKAGTGETISIEALGGASAQVDRHGLADHGADSEAHALATLRAFLSYLPGNARQPAPRVAPWQAPDAEPLRAIVPAHSRRAYDMHAVLQHLVDVDSLLELKPTFARNLVVALARLEGRAVGIVANQPSVMGGMLDAAACEKGARFIAMCDAFGLPLVHLIDVPGFSIGSQAEGTVLGRRSAKLLFELGQATVPRVSVVLRKGYGLGFYAMNGGRSFDADAALAWPTAEICAMSVEGSVDVAYRRDYQSADDPAARRRQIVDDIRARVGPLQAAAGFGIDDVIDPRDTRRHIAEVLARAPERRANPMPPKFRSIPPI